nr:hypothetical protein [Bacteroidota bacterium]
MNNNTLLNILINLSTIVLFSNQTSAQGSADYYVIKHINPLASTVVQIPINNFEKFISYKSEFVDQIDSAMYELITKELNTTIRPENIETGFQSYNARFILDEYKSGCFRRRFAVFYDIIVYDNKPYLCKPCKLYYSLYKFLGYEEINK